MASAYKVVSVADHFGVARLGNRSDHINPTHYGSPIDGPFAHPPINCKLDEDGLLIMNFVINMSTGKETQVIDMWCAPNTTRSGEACPTDIPKGATTQGAKPAPFEGGGNCILGCTATSDCGGGATCTNESNVFMCMWPYGR